MKIIELLKDGRPHISGEVFPTSKWENFEKTKQTAGLTAAYRPDFLSVTYGAGGGISPLSAGLAGFIKEEYGVPVIGHLTCVSSDHETVVSAIEDYRQNGIQNILALRGDIPAGQDKDTPRYYHHASELVREIRDIGGFCIGGACYPDGHPESASLEQDLVYTAEKVRCGCEFLISQMFFDNGVFYNYLYRLLKHGVDVPVVAGIMPVTNPRQITRIMKLSGTQVPARFKMIVDRFGSDPESMKQAGIAYATEQIIDLIANGVNNIHIYTMNKPEIIGGILKNLSFIAPRGLWGGNPPL